MAVRVLVLLGATACGFHGQGVTGDAAHAIDAPRAIDAGIASDVMADSAKLLPDSSTGLDCPTGSGWMALSGSTYFFSGDNDNETWWQAEATCEGKTGGGSQVHLAVITSLTEAAAVATHMVSPNAWIGMFQPLTALTPGDDWRAITGGPAYALDWETGEPNDFDNNEMDHMENFAELNMTNQTFNDTSGMSGLHYVCECDGLPVINAGVPPAPPM